MSSHVIEQHAIDLGWARGELEHELQQRGRLLGRMRDRPSILEGLAASVEEHFMYTAAVEPDSPALMDAARVAARVLTTLIGFANGDKETRVIDLGSTKVEAAPFEAEVDAQQWLRAFSYAVIARDEEASERLAKVEIQTLRQGAKQRGVEMDGYHYIWVATLKSWRQGRDIVNHLIDLALACAAHDGGMKVTVESGYLPAKLITAK